MDQPPCRLRQALRVLRHRARPAHRPFGGSTTAAAAATWTSAGGRCRNGGTVRIAV